MALTLKILRCICTYTGQQCLQIITTFVNNVKRFMVLALIAWIIQSLQYLSLNKCLKQTQLVTAQAIFYEFFSFHKKKITQNSSFLYEFVCKHSQLLLLIYLLRN
jgi:hypothetical protein